MKTLDCGTILIPFINIIIDKVRKSIVETDVKVITVSIILSPSKLLFHIFTVVNLVFHKILALGLSRIPGNVRQIAAVRFLIKEVYDGIIWMSKPDEILTEKFCGTLEICTNSRAANLTR